eukprot:gene25081-1645_t
MGKIALLLVICMGVGLVIFSMKDSFTDSKVRKSQQPIVQDPAEIISRTSFNRHSVIQDTQTGGMLEGMWRDVDTCGMTDGNGTWVQGDAIPDWRSPSFVPRSHREGKWGYRWQNSQCDRPPMPKTEVGVRFQTGKVEGAIT